MNRVYCAQRALNQVQHESRREPVHMSEFKHQFVQTNGIRMHVAEAGEGYPVVFCHGFPEMWYSWRHQMRALADAGFRAIAPDQRGYRETDAPEPVTAHTQGQLLGAIAG